MSHKRFNFSHPTLQNTQGRFTPHFRKRKPSQGCFAGERKSPDGENQACKDASQIPPAPQILSIALLSIWGASLLPIANCLSLAYPRLSERQPVGCHLSYLRSRYSHIIAHVHPLTAALVSPQTSAKRTPLPPIRGLRLAAAGDVASSFLKKFFYFFILHFWPLFRHFLLFLGHFLPFLSKVLF